MEEELDVRQWTSAVLDASQGHCANCGGEHKVSPRLVVPLEAGGKRVLSNSVLLCRACELASGIVPRRIGDNDRRLINIWVSDSLNAKLRARRDQGEAKSIGSFVRYLMGKYVADQRRFDDLAQYQDSGTDVRLNIWVDADLYTTFKTLVDSEGLTVTSALKSLFCMYEAEASPLMEAANRRKNG